MVSKTIEVESLPKVQILLTPPYQCIGVPNGKGRDWRSRVLRHISVQVRVDAYQCGDDRVGQMCPIAIRVSLRHTAVRIRLTTPINGEVSERSKELVLGISTWVTAWVQIPPSLPFHVSGNSQVWSKADDLRSSTRGHIGSSNLPSRIV